MAWLWQIASLWQIAARRNGERVPEWVKVFVRAPAVDGKANVAVWTCERAPRPENRLNSFLPFDELRPQEKQHASEAQTRTSERDVGAHHAARQADENPTERA